MRLPNKVFKIFLRVYFLKALQGIYGKMTYFCKLARVCARGLKYMKYDY